MSVGFMDDKNQWIAIIPNHEFLPGFPMGDSNHSEVWQTIGVDQSSLTWHMGPYSSVPTSWDTDNPYK